MMVKISRKMKRLIKKINPYGNYIIHNYVQIPENFLSPEEWKTLNTLIKYDVLYGDNIKGYTLDIKYIQVVFTLRQAFVWYFYKIPWDYIGIILAVIVGGTLLDLLKSHILGML